MGASRSDLPRLARRSHRTKGPAADKARGTKQTGKTSGLLTGAGSAKTERAASQRGSRNELFVIEALLELVDAQREYAATGRGGSPPCLAADPDASWTPAVD